VGFDVSPPTGSLWAMLIAGIEGIDIMSLESGTATESGRQRVRPIGTLGIWVIVLMLSTVAVLLIGGITDAVHLADFEQQWETAQATRTQWQSTDWTDTMAW